MGENAPNDKEIELGYLSQCTRDVLKQIFWFIFGIIVSYFPLFVAGTITYLRLPDIDVSFSSFFDIVLHISISTNDFRYICISALFVLYAEKSLLYKDYKKYNISLLVQGLDWIIRSWFIISLLIWVLPVIDESIFDNIDTFLLSLMTISATLILGVLTLITYCATKYVFSLEES